MRHWNKLILWVCAVTCLATPNFSKASGQNKQTWTVQKVLQELDEQARDFHSLSADVERTKVTVVVNDRSTEDGTILVHGDKMRRAIALDRQMPCETTRRRAGAAQRSVAAAAEFGIGLFAVPGVRSGSGCFGG